VRSASPRLRVLRRSGSNATGGAAEVVHRLGLSQEGLALVKPSSKAVRARPVKAIKDAELSASSATRDAPQARRRP